MDEIRVVKSPEAQPSRAESSEAPPRERRPFTPPAVQELGELKELTQQVFSG